MYLGLARGLFPGDVSRVTRRLSQSETTRGKASTSSRWPHHSKSTNMSSRNLLNFGEARKTCTIQVCPHTWTATRQENYVLMKPRSRETAQYGVVGNKASLCRCVCERMSPLRVARFTHSWHRCKIQATATVARIFVCGRPYRRRYCGSQTGSYHGHL